MYNILLTCPPMIKQISRYEDLLDKYNFKITIPDFQQVMTEEDLCKIIGQYDGWIIGDDPATKKVFQEGIKGNLKACVKWGVGTDNVDFDACKELNIPICNTPQMFGEEVSDVAIGYLLCLSVIWWFTGIRLVSDLWKGYARLTLPPWRRRWWWRRRLWWLYSRTVSTGTTG